MYKHAQVNKDNICVTISYLAKITNNDHLIKIEDNQDVGVDDIYDKSKKTWSKSIKTYENIQNYELISENEIINANILLSLKLNIKNNTILEKANLKIILKFYNAKIYDKDDIKLLSKNGVISEKEAQKIIQGEGKNGQANNTSNNYSFDSKCYK